MTKVNSEEMLVNFILSFVSLLVVAPGHPEQGPFYLIKGLLQVVNIYPWEDGSTAKARIFMALLDLFSTLSQKDLPYHISGGTRNLQF
jgi:hypothetical protein